ncbi:ABC transporter permease [Agromyces sp. H66]|uniref:ABC transporter permease n=1 Tax=Agromyces sp. H66 TaxID=2529859 RepID=UPI00145AA1B9|nr:ABC transporter permease [Agromyces sp. H66]
MSTAGASTASGGGWVAQLGAQFQHAAVSLWRSLIVLIFSFGMPLAWLVLIGLVAGNAVIDESTGLRVMQLAAPSAIAMGAFFATMPSVAVAVGEAKDRLVLKRLRTTPMPSWAYVAGQVLAAAGFGAASVGATVFVAWLAYDVRLPAASVWPFIVTVLVALASFCALGIAVASVAPSARIAETVSIATAVTLAFISGVFVIGGALPAWLDALASALPLKPFLTAMQDQFDPSNEEPQWALPQLAVIAAWGVVGAVVAMVAFRWQPTIRRAPSAGMAAAETGRLAPTTAAPSTTRRRPSTVLSRVGAQSAAALRVAARRPGDLFFAIAVPLGLFLLLVTLQGDVMRADGIPVATFTAASMATWGIAVVSFMNTAESFARSRERGMLKRLDGTPSSVGELIAGRSVATVVLGVLVTAALLAVMVSAYGTPVTLGGIAVGLVVTTVGVASLVACGHLLAAALPSARAVGSVALILLFVLAFFSEVFLVESPEWMEPVGAVFPLVHLQHGLTDAWDPDVATVPWLDLAVLAAWGGAAGAAALLLERRRVRR